MAVVDDMLDYKERYGVDYPKTNDAFVFLKDVINNTADSSITFLGGDAPIDKLFNYITNKSRNIDIDTNKILEEGCEPLKAVITYFKTKGDRIDYRLIFRDDFDCTNETDSFKEVYSNVHDLDVESIDVTSDRWSGLDEKDVTIPNVDLEELRMLVKDLMDDIVGAKVSLDENDLKDMISEVVAQESSTDEGKIKELVEKLVSKLPKPEIDTDHLKELVKDCVEECCCTCEQSDLERVNLPQLEEVDVSESTISDLIAQTGLDKSNVMFCLDSIARGVIPVLVGVAGCGKTYTANRLGNIVYNFKRLNGVSFDKVFKTVIACSNISQNDLWGSFDAVSHICVGSLKYIWRQAEENPSNLYYIVLDEMLDMSDIRKTFGGIFAKLSELPENIVIVGTGNNGAWDLGGALQSDMMQDDGIRGRFDLIQTHNILESKMSEGYQSFFNAIETPTPLAEHLKKFVLYLDNKYEDKMLVPRKVVKFIQGYRCGLTVDEYKELLSSRIAMDKNYLIHNLFVSLPRVRNNDRVDKFKEAFDEAGEY